MEEKYVITIDGPDCTGKSTLWQQANTWNNNIQIRGIVSNIAYALKFDRNVDELIDLYNINPVNYVVYLLNPINDKKLEMLYNRMRNHIYDNDRIIDELKDASDTWKDYYYFAKAVNLLNERYKGELIIKTVRDNNFDEFKENIKDYNIQVITELVPNDAIKILEVPQDVFEKEAKRESEFKYIVFIKNVNKREVIDRLYEELDDLHKNMFDTLMENADTDGGDLYDYLEELTAEALAEYLDNYEFRANVNVRVDIDTDMECYIPLKEYCEQDCRCFEDYIYNDMCLMDDAVDAIKDAVNYTDDFEINVEGVR